MKNLLKYFIAVITVMMINYSAKAGEEKKETNCVEINTNQIYSGPLIYSWVPSDGLSSKTTDCVTVCGAHAGADKCIASGCTTIGKVLGQCASGCGTGVTYSWSPGGATVCNPTVCPTVTTIYTLTVTFAKSCCCESPSQGNCPQETCATSFTDTVTVTVCGGCCKVNDEGDRNEDIGMKEEEEEVPQQ